MKSKRDRSGLSTIFVHDLIVLLRRLSTKDGHRYTGTMRTAVTLAAPAKINLHLAIGGHRRDGFHSIASIFQAISLTDIVTVVALPGGGIEVGGDCGCAPEQNTVYKAARAFLAELPADAGSWGVRIDVEKRIPVGAGLGGGSSDAAATLKSLGAIFPGLITPQRLLELAAAIGSDVPFFMCSACACVRGRGELLEPLAVRQDFVVVIVDPGFPVSTREAYAWLDEYRTGAGVSPLPADFTLDQELDRFAAAYRNESPANWPFRNDFLHPLSCRMPELGACVARIKATGALHAAMSGSGSACFGVYGSDDQAVRAQASLSAHYRALVTFPLARLPDSI